MPQLTPGGRTPKPKKLKAVSPNIIADMAKVKYTIRGLYNDTAHFSKKRHSRSYYFSKVKEIWTAGRKHSKMRGNLKKMFLNLKGGLLLVSIQSIQANIQ